MRKLESVYKAMKWDDEKYSRLSSLASENTKDSRVFCTLPGEDTLAALKRIFHIQEKVFDIKFQEACSGSGQEERRIATLHSSSLCALLFFYSVTKEHLLKIEIAGIGNVEFFDVIFEYQNTVIENANPSNMDVTLLGKCGDKQVILFLESKFSEYITSVQKCLNIKEAYLKEEISKPLYENWLWYKADELNGKEFSVFIQDSPAYLDGLKQMISHYVGVRKFERGILKLNDGKSAGKDLYDVKNNIAKQAVQEKLRNYALEGDTIIVLGSIVFDVYGNDEKHKELQEYGILYDKLMKQLSEDAMQSGSDIYILENFYTYQQLFENKKGWLAEQIYEFYFDK